MKKIILITLLSLTTVSFSQEKKESSYMPNKGSFTTSLLLGRGTFIDGGTYSTFYNGSSSVSGEAPFVNTVDTNSNSLVNMAGLEGKYFFASRKAITLQTGVVFRHTPHKINIPAVRNGNNEVLIPAYNAVVGTDRIDVHFAPGVQWYFDLKSPKLLPYVGFSLPFNYARATRFDPTVNINNNASQITSLGKSHVELVGMGMQGVMGLDYYVSRDMFIGFDTKPVSVQYVFNGKKPQPGTLKREAENFTYSVFANFMFKIGFRLN